MSETRRATSMRAEEVCGVVQKEWDAAVSSAEWIGSGQWSDCFAFRSGDADHVIRVGHHVEDFRKDRIAARFATSALPVPEVVALGEATDGFYAISERVYGEALEHASNWSDLVQPVADLLDELRAADLGDIPGWGEWTSELSATSTSWSDYLLEVCEDPPGGRVSGWRSRLVASDRGRRAFDAGYRLLQSLVVDDVPRSLIHNDLFNRNVHVEGSAVTGVFDWGNSIVGDHLYDCALMCFWQPWLPHVQDRAVIAELRGRWQLADLEMDGFERRFRVCLLHVGLEHIAYNAYLEDMGQVEAVADRMEAVVETTWW